VVSPQSSNPVTEGQNAEQHGCTINITFCVSNRTFYITSGILLLTDILRDMSTPAVHINPWCDTLCQGLLYLSHENRGLKFTIKCMGWPTDF